ncbi:MAG: shikimate dehydrogenase [Clostridiales bacterium]|nr:shikimate dehydrogenase [Clostridiales bacterium]
MKHYGLIGEKLGHSLSRPIHEAIFREMGIDADYRIIEIPRDSFDAQTRHLLATLDGFNVTIPYKQAVMPLLRDIDPAAEEIGAVNTVLCHAQKGFNTDAAGFMGMLRHYGIDPAKGENSYILGSGSTAKTVRACLKRMGARKVTVVSRHPQQMDEISYADFYQVFPRTGGTIVNASSAGMWPRKDEDNICAIHPSRVDEMMRYALGVADVVYNPPHTFLTKAAERAGVPWCTGLYMLVAQAVEAEVLWQGMPMPECLVEKIMKEMSIQ